MGEGSTNKVVSWFGLGKKMRGKMLIIFSRQHDLVVMNTLFKKQQMKFWTWNSPGHRKSYQIDYIFVKGRFRDGTRDVKTLPGFDTNSHHNCLVAEVLTRLNSILKSPKRGN